MSVATDNDQEKCCMCSHFHERRFHYNHESIFFIWFEIYKREKSEYGCLAIDDVVGGKSSHWLCEVHFNHFVSGLYCKLELKNQAKFPSYACSGFHCVQITRRLSVNCTKEKAKECPSLDLGYFLTKFLES